MTILYADDDPDEIFIFYDIVKDIDPSIACITASNGEEALQILTQITPDVIFLDMHMPVVDGKECLKMIRQNSSLRTIPVILYSNEESEATVRYDQLGAAAFIRKTANIARLREQLRTILAAGTPIPH